jgi:hypothetical protein
MGVAFSPPMNMKLVLLFAVIGGAAAADHTETCTEDTKQIWCPNYYGLISYDSLPTQKFEADSDVAQCMKVDADGAEIKTTAGVPVKEGFCWGVVGGSITDSAINAYESSGLQPCTEPTCPIAHDDKNDPEYIRLSGQNCIQENLATFRREQTVAALTNKTLCTEYKAKATELAKDKICKNFDKCTAILPDVVRSKNEVIVEVKADTNKTSDCFGMFFVPLFQKCTKKLSMSPTPTTHSECGDDWKDQSTDTDTTYCHDFNAAKISWENACDGAKETDKTEKCNPAVKKAYANALEDIDKAESGKQTTNGFSALAPSSVLVFGLLALA